MTGVRPTGRGIGFALTAAVLLVAAPLLSVPVLLVVAALLGTLVVAALVSVTLARPRLAVRRSFDPEVLEPESRTLVRVELAHGGLFGLGTGRWRDGVPPSVRADAHGALPALSRRNPRTTVSYSARAARRGRHALGPLTVEVVDPFALARRTRRVGGTHDLVVLPRREDLADAGTGLDDDAGSAQDALQHVGLGADDVVARPYLTGDALKRMHWKATAHRGELMVRQEEQESDPRIALVLERDAGAFSTARDGGEWIASVALEWAVRAVASLVEHLHRGGHAVNVRAAGGTIERTVAPGADTLADALVDLAVLEPDHSPVPVAAAEGTVVLVLGRPGRDRAAAWVDRLGSGRRVVALVDESSPAAALQELERAGWRIVTHRPGDDVAPACCRVLAGGGSRAAS